MQRPPVFHALSCTSLRCTDFRHGGLAATRFPAPAFSSRPRVTVNSAVFHNASPNAHIEWRFP